MQAAFSFGKSRPAARTRILSGPNRAGAMRAADAWIIPIVQLVVGHVVVVDVTPHLLGRPIHDGIDLDQSKLRIPLDLARSRTRRCLVAAYAGDPGSERR